MLSLLSVIIIVLISKCQITMSQTIDKTTTPNYISKLINSSPSLTHLKKYPIINELISWSLKFYFINYIITLFSKITLDFKNVLINHFKFIIDWIDNLDKFNEIYILNNIDHFLPFLTKIHLDDLKISKIANKSYESTTKRVKEFEIKFKPIIIAKTNPLIEPINSNYQPLLDKYLPSKEPSSVPSSDPELIKSFKLISTTYKRSKDLVLNKVENVKQYPSKISSIYNENLQKNDQNVPKALANTSLEISNKTLNGLRLPKIDLKINGSNDVVKSENGHGVNGEISVGA